MYINGSCDMYSYTWTALSPTSNGFAITSEATQNNMGTNPLDPLCHKIKIKHSKFSWISYGKEQNTYIFYGLYIAATYLRMFSHHPQSPGYNKGISPTFIASGPIWRI